MSGINKAILIGRLGKDPEARTFDNGKMVANLNLAISETYKDQTGEKKEQTEWVNIVLWGTNAEIAAKYLKKGLQIYIEGKIRTRSWEKDGIKKYTTEVVGDVLQILTPKSESSGKSEIKSEVVGVNSSTDDDGLPF